MIISDDALRLTHDQRLSSSFENVV